MPVESHLTEITRLIQLAIAPVFLLTAIGTIINVLAQRLARIIDRMRALEEKFDDLPISREQREEELTSLDQRMRHTYLAIALAVSSVLCVGILIIVAFLDAMTRVDVAWMVGGLFILALALFVGALLVFLREIVAAVRFAHARTARRVLRDSTLVT